MLEAEWCFILGGVLSPTGLAEWVFGWGGQGAWRVLARTLFSWKQQIILLKKWMSDIYSLLHWWMRCFSCSCGVNSIHLFFPFLLSTITDKHGIFVLLFSGPWTVPLRPHPLQPHGNIYKVMLIVRCIVNFTTSTHVCRYWLTGIWANTQRANLKCFAVSWNRKRKSESKEAMCFLTIRWHNNYDTGPLSLQLQSVWSVIYFNTELSGFKCS